MLRTFASHIRNQWAGFLSLFLVLTGGIAYAANTIGSTDIINNEVYGADVRDDTLADGGLGHVDLKAGSVRSSEVGAESLTGADVANQSGVDTCVSTIRFGQLCFRAENTDRDWNEALEYCAGLDLRLPSVAEAMELVWTRDLPDVGAAEDFWTDELIGESTQEMVLVDDNGGLTSEPPNAIHETVCVTTPTN